MTTKRETLSLGNIHPGRTRVLTIGNLRHFTADDVIPGVPEVVTDTCPREQAASTAIDEPQSK
jgi:hypothetical protein